MKEGIWCCVLTVMLLAASILVGCGGDGNDLSCGPGTVADDGVCVPAGDGADVVSGDAADECEEGYTLVEGQCVLPQEYQRVESVSLGYLSMEPARGGDLELYFPVTVTAELTVTGDPMELQASVLLREKGGEDFCYLGGLQFDVAGDGQPTAAMGTFYPGPACLGDAEGSFQPGATREVEVELYLDPNSAHLFADAASHSLALTEENKDSPEVSSCVSQDAEGNDTSCVRSYTVSDSPGIDIALDEFELQNPVVVLQVCPEVDPDTPDAYQCNGAIEKNENGDYVYSMPDLATHLGVTAYGTVSAHEDDQEPDYLADENLQLVYSIRPSAGSDEDWMPLYMHTPGDPAKAGPQDPTSSLLGYKVSQVVALSTRYFANGLYVENDCGEKNLDTCDPDINPRDRILTGDWSDTSRFVVRACVEATSETLQTDAAAANNCQTAPLWVVREGVGAEAQDASWWDKMNWDYYDYWNMGKSKTLHGKIEYWSQGGIGYNASRAYVRGQLNVDGKFNKEIAYGTFDYKYNMKTFEGDGWISFWALGTKLWTYDPGFKPSWTWEKEVSWGKDYGTKISVPGTLGLVKFYVEAGASVGVVADIEISLKDQGNKNSVVFDGGVRPYAEGAAEAGFNIDLWLVDAYAGCSVNFLDLNLPLVVSLAGSHYDNHDVEGSVESSMKMQLNCLSGYCGVWGEYWSWGWKDFKWYLIDWDGVKLWDKTLFSKNYTKVL